MNRINLFLSQILDLRSSNKHAALQNLSIYYTRKNIRKQYQKNKLKRYRNKKIIIIAPTLNDEFELPDDSYSVSDIQDYIKYIKKAQNITTIPAIRVYINRLNNRLVFKIKDGYKLELQTPETMNLFGCTKKLIDKTKYGENEPSLKVDAVVLV